MIKTQIYEPCIPPNMRDISDSARPNGQLLTICNRYGSPLSGADNLIDFTSEVAIVNMIFPKTTFNEDILLYLRIVKAVFKKLIKHGSGRGVKMIKRDIRYFKRVEKTIRRSRCVELINPIDVGGNNIRMLNIAAVVGVDKCGVRNIFLDIVKELKIYSINSTFIVGVIDDMSKRLEVCCD